jgi:hypothetical protein
MIECGNEMIEVRQIQEFSDSLAGARDDAAFAFSVDVGVDDAFVLSRKGDVLLRHSESRKKESR